MTKKSWLGHGLLISTLSVAGCSASDPLRHGSGAAGDDKLDAAGGAGSDDNTAGLGGADTDPGDMAGLGGSGAHSGGNAGSNAQNGGNAGAGATPGGVSGASGSSGGAGSETATTPHLPARIRRLTNAEYNASVQALLGTSMQPSVEFSFPPDARQGPSNSPAGAAFTVNDAQRVDPVLAGKFDAAAQALVAEARNSGKLAELAPCADASAAGGEACAATFLRAFGERAYRRPLSEDEVTDLVSRPGAAYHVGADGYTYEDGIDLLTRVVLQTPAFLYVTELGASLGTETFELTANEIASSLSYLLTSGPPDSELLAAAASGELATPSAREAEARRLLNTPAGRQRLVQVVREWLGIDEVARREKAQSVYPEFASASQALENESRAFIEEVLYNSSGTLRELLTADWTIAEEPLAPVYGLTVAGAGQRTSLTDVARRGILNQGAFLSVFASNNGSHPVFRGVAIMRRVACLDTPDPGALGIVVSFPASDATKTTRTRFEQHSLDPGCAACHTTIDALGFSMENFDGIGKLRTAENGLSIDTTVTVNADADFDGTYGDSPALLAALAGSASVKTCLARQIFRSSAGRSDESSRAAEDAFVDLWLQLPAEQQDRLVDVLVAYVASPLFVERRPQ
jgi:hypothetical protein